MSKLSIGAMQAWQVAAGEAVAAGHEFIDPEHLLIGVCSLDKWLKSGVAAEPQAREAALVERDAVAEALRGCGLDVVRLRRLVREKLGRGNHELAGRVVHRSEECKAAFRRAEALVGPGRGVTCLHLLAALMEDPGPIVGQALGDARVPPEHLRHLAQVFAPQIPAVVPAPGRSFAAYRAVAAEGTPYLDRYGRDLTQAAVAGNLRSLRRAAQGVAPDRPDPGAPGQE